MFIGSLKMNSLRADASGVEQASRLLMDASRGNPSMRVALEKIFALPKPKQNEASGSLYSFRNVMRPDAQIDLAQAS